MTALLLSQLPWAAAVIYLVRSHRADSAERHQALVAERDEHRKERRELLNRIQAPEAAQKQAGFELALPDIETPAYVPFDDDDAFHDARGVTTDGVA